MDNPIDFVIPWVDGSDKAWLKEKNIAGGLSPEENLDSHLARYRDWHLLHYWFRGVEKFAPWVNKIHFVTWGHVQKWLNTNHPKLNIVTHADYIPAKYLPTFCNHPIELNFHRIKGLTEQFVYLNDDMFMVNHLKPTDFFINGLPRDQAILSYITMTDTNPFPYYMLNNIGVLNRHFNKRQLIKQHKKLWYHAAYGPSGIAKNLLLSWTKNFPGLENKHIHQPHLKTTFTEVWEKEYDKADATCLNKFRHMENITHFSVRDWQMAKGQFVPINLDKIGKNFHIAQQPDALLDAIKHQKYKIICANDTDALDNFEEIQPRLDQAFSTLLPETSSFEQ